MNIVDIEWLHRERDQISKLDLYSYSVHKDMWCLRRAIDLTEDFSNNKLYGRPYDVSKEDMLEYFKSIIRELLETIERFKNWLKTNYHRLHLKFIKYKDKIETVNKLLHSIRDKNYIRVDKKSIDLLIKLFNTDDTDIITNNFNYFLKQLDSLPKVVESIVSGNPPKGFIFYDLGGIRKETRVSMDNKLSFKDSHTSNDIPTNHIEDSASIEYTVLTDMISGLSLGLNKIDHVLDVLDKVSDICKKSSISVNKDDFTKNNFTLLKNLVMIEQIISLDMLKWFIRSVKYSKKVIDSILDYNVTATPLSYTYFISEAQNNPGFYKANPEFQRDLGDPRNFKLIENGQYVYIDFKIPPTSTKGPGVSYNSVKLKDISKDNDSIDLERETFSHEGGFDFYKMGLVFLDTEYIQKHSKFLDFKVCYWHEVGHIVTRQNELSYTFNSSNPKDSWVNVAERYIRHSTENMADAFALIKTNISLEKLWESRMMALMALIDHNPEKIGVLELGDRFANISPRRDEYMNNVKKYIPDIRKYTKLDLFSYLRSYVKQ